ncbi:MAG: hypothetical protein Q8M24_06765 [Pseudolabrys sp.]|nr:hypothetical protein [Pseudolabrys sp.]MDP2295151.1 hypothetical protein [Pseudolabrys sp.]
MNQSTLGGGGAKSQRPKTVVVSDFVIAPEVLVLDRGFTTRLERKIGVFPTHERKQRTLERVNDEIVATIVATLREAGLDAQPGSEEGLSLSDSTLLVTGKLRPADPAAKKNEYGIGGGKAGVIADMALSSFSGFGKRQLLAFSAEPAGGKPAAGKQAAAANALIAEALVSNKAAPEKLSGEVEAAARKIGRGAGERIVAYGRTQGWFEGGAEAAPVAEEKPAKPQVVARAAITPEVKPEPRPRPARKPAAPAAADSEDTPAED